MAVHLIGKGWDRRAAFGLSRNPAPANSDEPNCVANGPGFRRLIDEPHGLLSREVERGVAEIGEGRLLSELPSPVTIGA
jgi:hypothetical protein